MELLLIVQYRELQIIKAKDDKDALDRIRNIMKSIGDYEKAGFDRIASQPPKEKKRRFLV